MTLTNRKPMVAATVCSSQYARRISLPDGAQLVLRPIRAEDESMWHALIARCSEDTIWHRFGYLFKATTHEMGQRFCAIDYGQSIAIVAEVVANGLPELVGVARLIASPSHCNAEYAVLIEDTWQSRGLGTLLTHYCLEICKKWGIVDVIAVTTSDNLRMQRILRKEGFSLEKIADSDFIYRKHVDASIAPTPRNTSAN